MHSYRERLRAPASWWLGGLVTVFMLGAIVWTGFNIAITLGIFAALYAVVAAFLVNWGRARIEVSDGVLRADKATLPLSAVGQVRPLDESQARALRGPRADPSAFLLIRPYLHRAVFVQVTEGDSAAPYWLVATRHPAELAAAIESSRPVITHGERAMG